MTAKAIQDVAGLVEVVSLFYLLASLFSFILFYFILFYYSCFVCFVLTFVSSSLLALVSWPTQEPQ